MISQKEREGADSLHWNGCYKDSKDDVVVGLSRPAGAQQQGKTTKGDCGVRRDGDDSSPAGVLQYSSSLLHYTCSIPFPTPGLRGKFISEVRVLETKQNQSD